MADTGATTPDEPERRLANEEPPPRLDNEDAGRVPRLPDWWKLLCWFVFLAGVVAVLIGLFNLVAPSAPLPWVDISLAAVSVATFLFAAFNTHLAAERFTRRRDLLRSFLSAHLAKLMRDHAAGTQTSSVSGERRIAIEAHRGAPDEKWWVKAEAPFVPMPYGMGGTSAKLNLSAKEYFEALDEEIHEARVAAGRIAAALGTLFIAEIHTYARVVDAARNEQMPVVSTAMRAGDPESLGRAEALTPGAPSPPPEAGSMSVEVAAKAYLVLALGVPLFFAKRMRAVPIDRFKAIVRTRDYGFIVILAISVGGLLALYEGVNATGWSPELWKYFIRFGWMFPAAMLVATGAAIYFYWLRCRLVNGSASKRRSRAGDDPSRCRFAR